LILVERVEKQTDNNTPRCFAKATDAHPRFSRKGDQS